ncbi:hypothetical protein ACSBR2_023848 [Camellia fascicularis]
MIRHRVQQFLNLLPLVRGDEVSLQRALRLVHKNIHVYVAVLFYASWCPFSGAFRPTFSILSTWYPSIPHFAIEESVIRPREFASAGDIFGLGHCIRAFEVALFHFTNSVCMYSIGLETVHPEYEVKELMGTSSGLSESSNPVIQFPKGALQEK